MRRVILIAADHADADAYRAQLPEDVRVVVTVTRRIPSAAHGHTADEIIWTPAADELPPHVRARLLSACVPAIYAAMRPQ